VLLRAGRGRHKLVLSMWAASRSARQNPRMVARSPSDRWWW